MLALVLCAATACGDGAGPSVDVMSLEPELNLPTEYGRYDDVVDAYRPTDLNWTVEASATPTNSVCGTEAMWAWSDIPPGASSGDPTVRMYICATPSTESAGQFIDTFAIEDSVVPQNDNFEPIAVELKEPLTNADYASVACVWGAPDECRAWAVVAQYGRYVAQAHWISAASGGALDVGSFDRLIRSIDEFARVALIQ